jgi:hypothetical protein
VSPETWGVDIKLYEGARYSDVKKREITMHKIHPQTLADILRSLAREIERDAGLRSATVSAPAEPADLDDPEQT